MGREQGLADAPCWVPVFPAEPAGHIHFVTNMGWDAGGRQKLVQPAMVQTHSYVNCQYIWNIIGLMANYQQFCEG